MLMKRRSILTALAAPLLAALALTPVRAQTYLVTELGLGGGFSTNLVPAINDSGQVVGTMKMVGSDKGQPAVWTPITPNAPTGTIAFCSLPPVKGVIGGTGEAINASGQVVGTAGNSTTTTGNTKLFGGLAFLWTSLTTTIDLGTLGGTTVTPFGMNDIGQVVGRSSLHQVGPLHAFLYSGPGARKGGQMFDLGVGAAWGINALGQVAGSQQPDGSHYSNPYVWTPSVPNGTTGSFTILRQSQGHAYAINASGQVVGDYSDSSGGGTFLWTPSIPNGTTGTFLDLGSLVGGGSSAFAINASGQVVGSSQMADGTGHAFLYSGEVMVDLNVLLDPITGAGWVLESATGINAAGQIVGWGSHNGQETTYLLTPMTPAP
jgi:probable HAF family extracellular repeat protein